ncbi:MAG: pyruvoyl-dependent arginine decarboxylase [Promethearchaeota archaeon]
MSETSVLLPKRFFVTSGKASSSTSITNAFDEALLNAGIGQYNLVEVSSIIPPDAKQVHRLIEIPAGIVVFAIIARKDGKSEEAIGAGIGWAWGILSTGKRLGIVVKEETGSRDPDLIKAELEKKLKEMASIRNMKLLEIHTRAEQMEVPKDKFGSVVVAFVYLQGAPLP